ncbi:sodium:solute symporter family transporter [Candidatus Mycoplasma pogonae]
MVTLSQTTAEAPKESGLTYIDWIIIALYLVLILGIGLFFFLKTYFAKKDNTNNFFTGGGKNPIVVVGLSLWATITSSLFFVNTAGTVVDSAWLWAGANVALIGIAPLVAVIIIPFYRRIKETTAYAFLEKRFSYAVRAINSISFILFQVFRVAIVLFVPVTVLTVAVDFNPYLLLIIMGIVVVLMTAFGGFKAVIWSDAIQGAVLLIGIFVIIIMGLSKTDWGLKDGAYHKILSENSYKIGLGTTGMAFIFMYSIVNSLYAFMGSQDVTQRYKGTKSLASVKKTLYITSGLGVVTMLLFFGAGSILWTFYARNAEYPGFVEDGLKALPKINGDYMKAQNFLPFFIATQLPTGLIGLLFAAIFAASQSTVSSGLSAVANSIIVDFVQRGGKSKLSDKALTWISKGIVLLFGSLAVLSGALLIYTKQDKLFDYFTGVISILNAPTVAVFILGIFSVRANFKGVLVGQIVALIIGIPIWLFTQNFMPDYLKISFHGGWLTLVTFLTTLIVGYFTSLIFTKLNTMKIGDKMPSPPINEHEIAKLINRTVFTTTKEWKELSRIDANIHIFEKLVAKKQIDPSYLKRLEERYKELDKIVSQQSN